MLQVTVLDSTAGSRTVWTAMVRGECGGCLLVLRGITVP